MGYLYSETFLTIKYFFYCKSIQTNYVYWITFIILLWDNYCWIHKIKMNFFENIIYYHFSSRLFLILCDYIFRSSCLIRLPYFIMKAIIIIFIKILMFLNPVMKIIVTQSLMIKKILSACFVYIVLLKKLFRKFFN